MSLFRKYGESLLDQPIGIEESRVRQAKESEARGTIQSEKRLQRVARRAYRQAMRNKDFGSAMRAIDWIDQKSGGMNPNITQHSTSQDMARNPAGNGLLPPGEVASTQDQPMTHTYGSNLAGPPAPSNLQRRIGLFGEMKAAAAAGGDLLEFRERASKLGIDNAGFARGANKAFDSAPPLSLDSPSFTSRLTAFGGLKKSLFDRHA